MSITVSPLRYNMKEVLIPPFRKFVGGLKDGPYAQHLNEYDKKLLSTYKIKGEEDILPAAALLRNIIGQIMSHDPNYGMPNIDITQTKQNKQNKQNKTNKKKKKKQTNKQKTNKKQTKNKQKTKQNKQKKKGTKKTNYFLGKPETQGEYEDTRLDIAAEEWLRIFNKMKINYVHS